MEQKPIIWNPNNNELFIFGLYPRNPLERYSYNGTDQNPFPKVESNQDSRSPNLIIEVLTHKMINQLTPSYLIQYKSGKANASAWIYPHTDQELKAVAVYWNKISPVVPFQKVYDFTTNKKTELSSQDIQLYDLIENLNHKDIIKVRDMTLMVSLLEYSVYSESWRGPHLIITDSFNHIEWANNLTKKKITFCRVSNTDELISKMFTDIRCEITDSVSSLCFKVNCLIIDKSIMNFFSKYFEGIIWGIILTDASLPKNIKYSFAINIAATGQNGGNGFQ